MSLAYALLTRFDIAVYLIALQKFLQKPQYIHLRKLNAVLRWAQQNNKKYYISIYDMYENLGDA